MITVIRVWQAAPLSELEAALRLRAMGQPPPRRPLGRPDPDPDQRGSYVARLDLPDGSHVFATMHCVDRFWERVASSESSFEAARKRLRTLAGQHARWVDAPRWVGDIDGDNLRWLAISDDIVFLVNGEAARTCLTRGGLTPRERRLRRRARRRKR